MLMTYYLAVQLKTKFSIHSPRKTNPVDLPSGGLITLELSVGQWWRVGHVRLNLDTPDLPDTISTSMQEQCLQR